MNNNKWLLESLRKIEYFSGLEEDALCLLQDKMHLETFKEGETVCTEGETGNWMFILESGELSVLKRRVDGTSVEISVLKSNDIGGVMSLFGEGTRTATLRARVDSKAWILDHSTFHQLTDDDEAIDAESEYMEYNGTTNKLILLRKATVTQAGHTISSERIEYNTITKIVDAGDPKTGHRVKMTIIPETTEPGL